ncbi:two-component regulator propeller domain-containing protein [Limibacter armeniacum]|uniref:hybrid sensor histidine kinase/response regulator transcription factor n=1 Tax=Limibacter armeniacum TaxID=466084 RepID=UPI002FE57838
MKMRITLTVLCFFLAICIGYSQNSRFETIGREEGLSHSIINNIVQDRTGYLWFGTQDGLVRYDGYNFRTFRPVSGDSNSIYDSWLTDLFVDSRNRIWSRFESGGLSVYNPLTEDFVHLLHEEGNPKSISSDIMPSKEVIGHKQAILEDSKGFIWIATVDGLNKVSPDTYEVTRYSEGLEMNSGLTGSMISAIYFDQETEMLWVGTNQGLNRINLKTNAVRHYTTDSGLTDNYIKSILKDRHNTLWIGGRRAGIMRCDLDVSQNIKSVQSLLNREDLPYQERSQTVYKLLESKSGDIWAGMQNGLYCISINGKQVRRLTSDKHVPMITNVIEDFKGDIWAGGANASNGLFHYSYNQDKLKEYKQSHKNLHGYSYNIINDLMVDRSGVLWVGTGKGGLIRYNIVSKGFASYSEPQFKAVSEAEDEVYSIYVDQHDQVYVGTKTALAVFDSSFTLIHKYYSKTEKGSVIGALVPVPHSDQLWVGYFEGKVGRFNPKTEVFQYFNENSDDPSKGFTGWSLRDILVSRDRKRTYFATMSSGLIVKENQQAGFHSYHTGYEGVQFNTGAILNLMEDERGRIWMGTSNQGIIIFDPTSKQVSELKHIDKLKSSISHNEVRTIHQSNNGTVWIGTRYGLNSYDPASEIIKQYYVEDGLPSNIIHGILEDDHGNIWLSTNMGISKFSPSTQKFTNFLKEDGLQGNEFNECAYFKDRHGYMYFGGVNGVTRFHPDSIRKDDSAPHVILSGLVVNQQKVEPGDMVNSMLLLEKSIQETETLTLNHMLNSFSVSFSTLDFRVPKKHSFRYRLLGLEKDWQYNKQGEYTATYGWLPIGEYILEVQASNIDGDWSGYTKQLNVVVLPPWWKSIWFRILALMLIITVALTVVILNIRRLHSQRKLLEQTVKERTHELVSLNEELETQQEQMISKNKLLEQNQQELEQQQRNIQLLSKMGQKITSTVELQDVFTQIYAIVSELMDINELMVGAIDEQHHNLDIWGIKSGEEDFTYDQIPLEAKDRLSVKVVRNRSAIISNNLTETSQTVLETPHPKYSDKEGPKSGIYLPLTGQGGKVKGVIVAFSYMMDAYGEKEVAILENLASYVSIAMDNANAYEQIKLQSAQLMQVDKIKSDFYANVSHEFRTPLTLIKGPTQELMKSGKRSAEELKLINIINRNTQILLSLVEQIMELSRIDGGAMKVSIKHNCLSDQLKTIGESFKHLAVQKSIRLNIEIPSKLVRGHYDYDILNKVSYNLLNNAIKYTQQGGAVSFKVAYEMEGVRLVVSDNGKGIPKEDLQHIFDRFYRGSLTNEHQETGAGIGLALVHQLLEMVDGSIEAESRYFREYMDESGTTFRVWIPVKSMELSEQKNYFDPQFDNVLSNTPSPSAVTQKMDRANELLKTKILVVEDNRELREFLEGKLGEIYYVISAENGKEALEIAREEQPYLILSDVMMPVMNGIELCATLKQDMATSHIPVILITAKDAEKDQMEGLRAGASDYIVKPFNTEEVMVKANNILEKRIKLIEHFRGSVWTGIQDLGNELSPQDQKFLAQVKDIIEQQIDDPTLDIDFFCSELGVSRTWLYNKMKALLDMSMNEFIRNSRLKYGAKLLLNEKMTVSQAAYAVGYNDPKYFTRCFKKEFGIGPKAYVQQSVLEVK